MRDFERGERLAIIEEKRRRKEESKKKRHWVFYEKCLISLNF